MDVVGYMHHADLLLEDEQGVAIIGGGNYVLSIGDRVFLKRQLDGADSRYIIEISFASNQYQGLFEDQCQMKFSGNRAELSQYLTATTVH
ncbi:hypothetical protein [Acinetobacter pragensis]|uniref:Uncharacterized protein n=1 Tax=Acinetobacter pragensis TaxID=1806892 RepID=A0A151XXP9_9GAMM|nr:hypothetical protein [Acinetobacter pragensis]KYQ70580.1 hypothetical protein AZH43_03685 [Acinetobacter pragensis]